MKNVSFLFHYLFPKGDGTKLQCEILTFPELGDVQIQGCALGWIS